MVSTSNILDGFKSTSEKYLLAVSGGIDSMAMASMFVEAGTGAKIGVAHCNFGLRGDESDDDEAFVHDFARCNNLRFHVVRFDTSKYAATHGLSIQQAARTLRYEWFETLRREHGYRKVAVAHNADDNLETFFINLLRGAGLGGLTGITAETESIVRPLINMSRRQIEEYARERGLAFREDSSNESDKYLRNKLRHTVLPALDEVNPTFREKATESLKRLKQANDFVSTVVDTIARNIAAAQDDDLHISISGLERYANSAEFVVFRLLEPYGFKGEIVADIVRSLKGESGRMFVSDEYILVKDREFLIVSPRKIVVAGGIVEKAALPATVGGFRCEIVRREAGFKPEVSPELGQLDADKLQFPLVLRTVKPGDWFVPFGMNGRKKLSDFLVDNKISFVDKRKQSVLVSGDDIVWLAGRRIDERYKITDETVNIFRITPER